jgi:hypothetical protein
MRIEMPVKRRKRDGEFREGVSGGWVKRAREPGGGSSNLFKEDYAEPWRLRAENAGPRKGVRGGELARPAAPNTFFVGRQGIWPGLETTARVSSASELSTVPAGLPRLS